MAEPKNPKLAVVKGGLNAVKRLMRDRDEPLSKIDEVLSSKQAPMTTPSGTGLPLMPRDQGMYTVREQKDLPRMPKVDAARAAGKSPKYTERMQDLLDSPTARKKVDKLINQGKDLNMTEWYGTEPLRQVAMDAGRTSEQFESLMAQLASASQRNPVDKQNQMGSYLYHLSETGQLPANSLLLTNKLKKALKEDPTLAEGRQLVELPAGYGSLAQGDIFNRAVMIGQGDIAGALPPNKKLGTFYENLLGNLKPVTVDVNAVRGPIIERGDPRWLTSKLVEKDEEGRIINSYKPREMFESGEMTMREAKQRPGFWEAAPSGSEYAGFEDLWQRGAKRHGVEPAEAQALGWYGSADVTALKTKPENYVDNLERLIKRTAEQTGQSPQKVMKDLVTGEGFLRKDGGAVDIKAADARLAKAIESRMAKGGSVDIEAADARLEAAINARMGMAGGGVAFKRLEFTEDDSPVQVGIHASKMGENESGGVMANLDMKGAGRFGVGSNLAGRKGEMHPSTMVNYSNNIGDLGINANVMKPMDAPNGMMMTNVMASYPIGEGRVSAGMHGNRMDGTHRVTGHSLGYNTPLGGGNLNVNMMKPKEGKPMFGAQYNRSFVDGGKVVKGVSKLFKKVFADDKPAVTKPSSKEANELAQKRASLPKEKGGLGLLENNTAEQRAQAMGYDKDVYHGTNEDFTSFKGDQPVFATEDIDIAKLYGKNTYPLKLRGEELTISDLTDEGHGHFAENLAKKLGLFDEADEFKNSDIRERELINALKERGIDRLRVTDMSDMGGVQTQHALPAGSENVRSRHAAFDPFRRSTAIATSMGVAAPDLLAEEVDKAEGGSVFKTLQFNEPQHFDGGGIAAQEFVDPFADARREPLLTAKDWENIKRNAPEVYEWAKQEVYEWAKQNMKEEVSQLGSARGVKDFALRTGAQYLGGTPDLINLGLMGVDALADTSLSSEKPYFGSERYIDALKKYGAVGENEFPIAETVAGVFAPAGLLKKGVKQLRKTRPKEESKKRRGGLAAMSR